MNQTLIITPTIAKTLERQRQQLDSQLGEEFAHEWMSRGTWDQKCQDSFRDFKKRCRELGALDEVCAAYGITDYVMATSL